MTLASNDNLHPRDNDSLATCATAPESICPVFAIMCTANPSTPGTVKSKCNDVLGVIGVFA